jgi:hypothetical protein
MQFALELDARQQVLFRWLRLKTQQLWRGGRRNSDFVIAKFTHE